MNAGRPHTAREFIHSRGVEARCELAIIGAGVIGCALAQRLAPRLGAELLVLDAAPRAGTGISSRNSGVVHAGLYYPPGSRKARSCALGNTSMWEWVRARGVGHRQTGKLVVARDAAEVRALEDLQANANANGVALEALSLARARALEPALPATVVAALWSASSGIVDVHDLVRSLLVAAEREGAQFLFEAQLRGIEPSAGGFRLRTARGPLLARRVINAAGLGANALAACLGLERRLYLARGDYYRLHRQPPWRRLIYPVKQPGSASLGVHLTLELDGRCRLGPDLDWVDDPDDFSPARGEAKHARFVAAARGLLGAIDPAQLSYEGCGIRPKLVGPREAMADFEVIEHPAGCWHLLGIESPGLTASLALARELDASLFPGPSRR